MPPRLMMPLFVDPTDVIERLQLNADLDGVIDVVSNAIMGAELHVEALLGSTITRKSQDCMFYTDPEAFSGIQPGGVFRLELPSGFLRSSPTPVITMSDASVVDVILNPDGSDEFGTFIPADSSLIKIDYPRGYLLMQARAYGGRYIRVQCDTGFEPGTNPMPVTGLPVYDGSHAYQLNDVVQYSGVAWIAKMASTGSAPVAGANWAPALIAMEQIPQALYEAIMSYVPGVFGGQATQGIAAIPNTTKASDNALLLLKDFVRVKGFSFRPLWSE